MSTNLADTSISISISTYKSPRPHHHDVASLDPCALLDKAQFLTYPCRDPRLRMRQTDGSAMNGELELDDLSH